MNNDWKDLFNTFMYELQDALFWHDSTQSAVLVRVGAAVQRAKDRAEKLKEKKEPQILNEVHHGPIQSRNDEHMRDWEPVKRAISDEIRLEDYCWDSGSIRER